MHWLFRYCATLLIFPLSWTWQWKQCYSKRCTVFSNTWGGEEGGHDTRDDFLIWGTYSSLQNSRSYCVSLGQPGADLIFETFLKGKSLLPHLHLKTPQNLGSTTIYFSNKICILKASRAYNNNPGRGRGRDVKSYKPSLVSLVKYTPSKPKYFLSMLNMITIKPSYAFTVNLCNCCSIYIHIRWQELKANSI